MSISEATERCLQCQERLNDDGTHKSIGQMECPVWLCKPTAGQERVPITWYLQQRLRMANSIGDKRTDEFENVIREYKPTWADGDVIDAMGLMMSAYSAGQVDELQSRKQQSWFAVLTLQWYEHPSHGTVAKRQSFECATVRASDEYEAFAKMQKRIETKHSVSETVVVHWSCTPSAREAAVK